MILFQPIYGLNYARTGDEAWQRGVAHPRPARRPRAPRLRHRQANRGTGGRADRFSRHVALSDASPAAGKGADRRPLGRETRTAQAPLLPAYARWTRHA